ncbi:MAG: undecaprenyl/decaprenyl-phosphate alpha-N-acetylglucosaminyl 1-phosphate transferase [Clostridia bacterium]|nr:undecaprenyl/decaprenyl-phosphate alpha-N-acetylglucosaminyl 1-phosphate transferase [Clostridia bacterium]
MLRNFSSPEVLYAIAALAFAFLLAYYGTPLVRRLAVLCGCFDSPDGDRKLHDAPVPYFGGLAILAGLTAALFLFTYTLTGRIPAEIVMMGAGGFMICLVGLIDDIYDMRPIAKLLCQVAIALFTAYYGFTIEYITLFGHTLRLGSLAVPLTAMWIVVIVNAVNLIDGLDGLAGGITALESFALLITAILMGNPVCAIASAALCGAVLGFLPFNFGKATIFMGDAGAMLIGYVMACISVLGLFKAQALFSIVVPAMIFALPVLDVVDSFFRRLLTGSSPFAADHKHLHYILLENGFLPAQSVLALTVAAGIFCVASVIYVRFRLVSIGLFLLGALFLAVLRFDKKLITRFKKKTVPSGTVHNSKDLL